MDASTTITLHSGNDMPVLGLGTWRLTGKQSSRSLASALNAGYRMIDTSGDYGNHREVGDTIRASALEREDVYLITKVEEDDDAYEAAHANLKELGLDYADLMLIHRPPLTDAGQELWDGLIKARNEGLVKDIGVSNYSIEFMQELADTSGEMPAVNQIEWSPFGYSTRMLDYCHRNDIVLQAYSPLTRTKRLHDATLMALAKKYDKSPAQLLIRWNIQHDAVPLPKATSDEHLEENISVFDFEISDEDMTTLDNLNEEYSSLSSLPYL